uniref:Uncharacterized protein n=1 Tax=Eptatretus burgeri TaxID=7764 RepID=A0A8C4NFE5_EPTBU
MDIRTRSVEQTLSRLVSQITTLVNGVGTPKTTGTSWGVGVAVELGRAVERFVAFGEALAENQPQVKVSAMEACGDARRAGAMLAALVCLRDPGGRPQKSPETAAQGGSEMLAGHVSQKNLPGTSSASLTTKVHPADQIDEDTKFSPLGSSTWKRASLSSLSGTVPSTHRDSAHHLSPCGPALAFLCVPYANAGRSNCCVTDRNSWKTGSRESQRDGGCQEYERSCADIQ